MRDFMNVIKALADENRVRAIMFLQAGELCVCQVIEMLALAPSTVSKHLNILHQAGLLESRKQGRWIYYRLANGTPCVRKALRFVKEALSDETAITQDAKRLTAVKKIKKDVLCCRYKA